MRGPQHVGACCIGVWPPCMVGRAALKCRVLSLVVLCVVVVCGPRFGGACCVGVCSPSQWGVLGWCVAPLMVGCAALGCDVLCCVAPRMAGRAALVCGPPHGGACCGGVWPPSGCGCVALCCVVSPCVAVCCVPLCCVVLCVVLRGPPHGGARCVCVSHPACSGMLLLGTVCCVLWRCVLWWCVAPRMVGRVAFVFGPPHGGACRGGVWPPSWWGCFVLYSVVSCCVVVSCVVLCCVVLCCVVLCCVVLCCVVLCCVVLCVVVVCGPPHGGACFDGVWSPSWWGVLRYGAVCSVAPRVGGRAAFVFGPPHGGACRGGVWPSSWWSCVVLRCVVS